MLSLPDPRGPRLPPPSWGRIPPGLAGVPARGRRGLLARPCGCVRGSFPPVPVCGGGGEGTREGRLPVPGVVSSPGLRPRPEAQPAARCAGTVRGRARPAARGPFARRACEPRGRAPGAVGRMEEREGRLSTRGLGPRVGFPPPVGGGRAACARGVMEDAIPRGVALLEGRGRGRPASRASRGPPRVTCGGGNPCVVFPVARPRLRPLLGGPPSPRPVLFPPRLAVSPRTRASSSLAHRCLALPSCPHPAAVLSARPSPETQDFCLTLGVASRPAFARSLASPGAKSPRGRSRSGCVAWGGGSGSGVRGTLCGRGGGGGGRGDTPFSNPPPSRVAAAVAAPVAGAGPREADGVFFFPERKPVVVPAAVGPPLCSEAFGR